jgi:predicted DNA-binding protein (MmcQ/YjbR family)
VRRKDVETFALSLKGATLDHPWGETPVYKVGGKMFAWGSAGPAGGQDDALAFKCSDLAFEMLLKRKGIEPAPYLAKQHWVQVEDPKAMDADEVKARLSEAHRLVAEKLPKKTQIALGLLDPALAARRTKPAQR